MSINQIKEGFKDFYSIESCELFPKNLIIDEIWPSLSVPQQDRIRRQTFYQFSAESKKIEQSENQGLVSLSSIDLLMDQYECLQDLCKKKNL